jgi:hypothetical protein
MSNHKRRPGLDEHLTLHMSRGVFLLLLALVGVLLLRVDPAELVRLIRWECQMNGVTGRDG